MRRLKRPVRHRLRRLRTNSDVKFDGIHDCRRSGRLDGGKSLAR